MRRLCWMFLLLALSSRSLVAQSSPEVDAVLNAFFAKDSNTVLKYLPGSMQKALAELSPADRAEITRAFMIAENLRRDGGTVTRVEDGGVLVRVEHADPNRQAVEISLDKRVSDGNGAVLQFKMTPLNSPHQDFVRKIQVWMHFEDGEWHISSAQFGDEQGADFENPEFVKQLRRNLVSSSEAAAVGSLRTINVGCITYAATYPDKGFPPNLDALGGSGTDPTPEHAELLPNTLTTSPYQKGGYVFNYRPQGGAPNESYTVTARPVQFGTTGTPSFFTDSSGVIRSTEEDREPTADDPPLQ